MSANMQEPARLNGAVTATEYLAFTLGGEEYGVDIQKVQELRGYDAVTQIANAPAYMKGVVNLRGIIVPIVDLRIKLGNATPSYDQFTVVVVLNLTGRTLGIVVDSVSDVTTLSSDQASAFDGRRYRHRLRGRSGNGRGPHADPGRYRKPAGVQRCRPV